MEAQQVKEWRKAHCLTQAKSAQLCRVSIETWRNWEQGDNKPPDMLYFAMRAYELSLKRGEDSRNHYIYKITCTATGKYYIGMRSCHCDIGSDPYMGSGKWTKMMGRFGVPLIKQVINILPNRDMATEIEVQLIRDAEGDILCMNEQTPDKLRVKRRTRKSNKITPKVVDLTTKP